MNKHRIRALGLCLLAALSLMAITVVGAQAANLNNGGTAGKFKVEGLEKLALNVPINGQIEALTGNPNVHLVLLVKNMMNLRILCASVDVEAGSKLINSDEGLIKAKFLGCVAIIPLGEKEEELKTCTMPGGALIATAKFLPRLHQDDGGVVELYLLFEGDPTTSPIATIEFEGEKGCPLPLKSALNGSVVALVKEGNVEQPTKLITFSEAIQRLFQERNKEDKFVAGDQLLFGASEAFIDGNATLSLGGAHTNVTWSVH